MCKAIDMMMQKREVYGIRLGEERGMRLGEERGMRLGEERGIRLGEERGIETARSIFRMYIKGCNQNEIADELHITAEKSETFWEWRSMDKNAGRAEQPQSGIPVLL